VDGVDDLAAVNPLQIAPVLQSRHDVGESRLPGPGHPDPAAVGGRVSTQAYKKVPRRDPCAYCGGHPVWHLWGGPIEIDHIVPRADGGPDDWSNYTAGCEFCNELKVRSMLAHLPQRPYRYQTTTRATPMRAPP
jgi:hypothetical protein